MVRVKALNAQSAQDIQWSALAGSGWRDLRGRALAKAWDQLTMSLKDHHQLSFPGTCTELVCIAIQSVLSDPFLCRAGPYA